MASNLSNELLDCIVSFLKLKLVDTLTQTIDEGHQQGKDTKSILDETLGGMLTQAVKAPPVVASVATITTNAVAAAPAVAPSPSSRKALAKDVLVDEHGQPIICQGIVQNTKMPCTHNSKYREADGTCTCGVHHRSYASKKADPTKKPGATTAKPGNSSFQGVVGIASGATFSKFTADDLVTVGDDLGTVA